MQAGAGDCEGPGIGAVTRCGTGSRSGANEGDGPPTTSDNKPVSAPVVSTVETPGDCTETWVVRPTLRKTARPTARRRNEEDTLKAPLLQRYVFNPSGRGRRGVKRH